MKMLVTQSCPTLCNPMDFSPPGSSVHGILQARILEWIVIPFSRGSSWPRDRTQVSCITDGFYQLSYQGRSKNTEVVSLSLLQRIFLIQESNQGLLHCRWIIYQLSYQGSPQHPYIYVKNRQHYLDNQGRECFAQNFNLSFLFSHSYSSTASIKLVVPSRIFTS